MDKPYRKKPKVKTPEIASTEARVKALRASYASLRPYGVMIPATAQGAGMTERFLPTRTRPETPTLFFPRK